MADQHLDVDQSMSDAGTGAGAARRRFSYVHEQVLLPTLHAKAVRGGILREFWLELRAAIHASLCNG